MWHSSHSRVARPPHTTRSSACATPHGARRSKNETVTRYSGTDKQVQVLACGLTPGPFMVPESNPNTWQKWGYRKVERVFPAHCIDQFQQKYRASKSHRFRSFSTYLAFINAQDRFDRSRHAPFSVADSIQKAASRPGSEGREGVSGAAAGHGVADGADAPSSGAALASGRPVEAATWRPVPPRGIGGVEVGRFLDVWG